MAHAGTAMTAPAGGRIRTASGINAILGLWLIIAAFAMGGTQAASWNDLLTGIVVLVLAGARMSEPIGWTKAASWANAAIGLWLIFAPFVLSYTTNVERWNDIIAGILLLIFGAWSGALPRHADEDRAAAARAQAARARDTAGDRTVTGTGAAARSRDRF